MELGVIQHARPGPVPEEGCPIIVSLLFSNGFRFGGVFVNILGAYEFNYRLDSMTVQSSGLLRLGTEVSSWEIE